MQSTYISNMRSYGRIDQGKRSQLTIIMFQIEIDSIEFGRYQCAVRCDTFVTDKTPVIVPRPGQSSIQSSNIPYIIVCTVLTPQLFASLMTMFYTVSNRTSEQLNEYTMHKSIFRFTVLRITVPRLTVSSDLLGVNNFPRFQVYASSDLPCHPINRA